MAAKTNKGNAQMNDKAKAGKKPQTKGKPKTGGKAHTRGKAGAVAQEAGKAKAQVKEQVTGDWLYFCPLEITVRDIYEVLADWGDAEIWEDAGVLELALGEKSSLDIESTQIHPKDEITQQFADTQGAKSVFLVTFMPEEYPQVKQKMQQVLEKLGGIFCGDTEDFTPVIR